MLPDVPPFTPDPAPAGPAPVVRVGVSPPVRTFGSAVADVPIALCDAISGGIARYVPAAFGLVLFEVLGRYVLDLSATVWSLGAAVGAGSGHALTFAAACVRRRE
jgi:hypothetical protein